MIAFFLLLVIVAIALGIIGVVAKAAVPAHHRNRRISRRPHPGRRADAATARQAPGPLTAAARLSRHVADWLTTRMVSRPGSAGSGSCIPAARPLRR